MYVILEVLYTTAYLIYCFVESLVRVFVPAKRKSLAGKLVLVTGAGQGIGREVAKQFSALGARLVLWDIRKDSVENVARELQENGGTATSYVCDVSNVDDVKSSANKVRREIGDVEILVNNAGILHGAALLDLSDEDIKRTVNVNLLAYFWTCRQFLPSMINKNSGHIVNVASMSAKRGVAYLTDYAASKFGVNGLTEALSDEMRREGHTGIRFTTVFPMFVQTNMTQSVKMSDRLDKLLTPEEVASAIVDGVQKNEKEVFVPKSMSLHICLANLLPRKFIDEPTDLIYRGIDPKE